jgi:hypothetical protein
MLRGVRLALLCLVAIATAPAQANDRSHAVAVARVAWTPPAQPARRAGSVVAFRDEAVDWPTGSASLLRPRHERQASVAFPWLRQSRSGVAVALTERLGIGFGYRYLEGEDLWPEFADTGATDYNSHHLLIRASWRF